MATTQRFEFAFDSAYVRLLGLVGVRPENAWVEVDDIALSARFGPWSVRTPRTNIMAAHITGPYLWWRVIGVRVSLADRGLTLGSNTHQGVCVELRVPVRGVDPWGLVRHPGLTATVAEPENLSRLLNTRPAGT
ncbi:hypothetical protein [Salinactinospora qingdaonensis]|uniref:Uncharacterized protein n=1 Tax=Salinactinospora qingdaonensis TaxID=702744 RepID=A0ABP7FTL6_9ACTN